MKTVFTSWLQDKSGLQNAIKVIPEKEEELYSNTYRAMDKHVIHTYQCFWNICFLLIFAIYFDWFAPKHLFS